MIVTIHQPNFFPWWPLLEKVQQADMFVYLTHCQFEKNGFQNRFKFNNEWQTMSVQKGLVSIKEKMYTNPYNDWDKIKNKLSTYKFFLDRFDEIISPSLEKTNIGIINKLLDHFDIKTTVQYDYQTELKSTERLVEICQRYGATTYLSGSGGKEYLDERLFRSAGINVIYQEITTPIHTLEML